MKVVSNNNDSRNVGKKTLLSLVPDDELPITKENSVSFSISTNPGTAGAPEVKTMIRVLDGSEAIRPLLTWRAHVYRILTGLNIQNMANKHATVEMMMKGAPLAAYKTRKGFLAHGARLIARQTAIDAAADPAAARTAAAAVDAQPEHDFYIDAHIDACIDYVIKEQVPKKALAKIKRSMRREMRKPADMRVRAYYQHIQRINLQELPHLPPFQPNQRLGEDEIVDILLFGSPKSWIREMDRQGFDPLTVLATDVVDFLEQIETSEDFDPEGTVAKKSNSSNNKKKSSGGGGSSKFCILHGKGGHDTDNCRTMQSQAKKLKSGGSGGGYSGGSKNKTWSRKASDDTNKSKKEFNSFVKKMVQKELNAISDKKRKASGEVHNVEKDPDVDGLDLENFNLDDWNASDNEHEDGSVTTEVSA